MKNFLLSIFIFILLLPSSVALAQGTYAPSTTTDNSGTFDGMSFDGLGAAVLSCSGAEDMLADALGSAQEVVTGVISDGLSSIPVIGGFLGGLFKAGVGEGEQTVKDKGLRKKESCLDKLAYLAGQKVLSQITVKTLNWVNTGFDGNPLYVRDIDSLLKSIRNEQITHFLPTVQNSDPIFGNALRAIITKQVVPNITTQTDALLKKGMDTPEAKAYQSFTQDFTQGGWSALLNSNNNPLSALFRETNKLNNSLANQANNTQQELIRNGGFLDMKKCVQYANGGVGSGNGDGLRKDLCLRYETRTPGSIIADQVKVITGSPVRQAENIDELNEILGSFFDSLLNKLFSKGGLAGLRGSGAGNGGTSQGINVVYDTNGGALTSESENVFDLPEFSSGFAQGFDVSRPQMVRAVLTAQHNYRNRSTDTVIAGAAVLPELGRLDYCMPGPNPTWQTGLDTNFNSMMNSLRFKQVEAGDVSIVPFPVVDKVTGASRTITQSSGPFEILRPFAGAPYVGIFFHFNRDSNEAMQNYFRQAYAALVNEINTTYNQTTIGNAFASRGDATINRGVAITAYRATETLVPYARSINNLLTSYSATIGTVEGNIAELEAINQEVQELVRIAKARYIAQRAASGNPVNMECINSAYVIDQSPVTGVARQESGTANTALTGLQSANDYFNSSI